MPLHDFRHLDTTQPIEADLCIVGSGPAGWTLAEELKDSGLRIVVLESGGALESGDGELEPAMEELNVTEDVGCSLFNGRRRTLGGTPEIVPWGNRCIPFDPIDYEQRPWVPHSGWPINAATMEPFLDKASRYLGAGPYLPDGPKPLPAPHGVSPPDVDPARLSNVTWWFGNDGKGDSIRYGRLFRHNPHDNVRVIVHATVTHLNTNEAGDQIRSVEIADVEGKRATVKARSVVLCTGGIENARILLYSNRVNPRGVGNDHDQVGRYLMDHPRDLDMALTYHVKHAQTFYKLFGSYKYDSGDGTRIYTGGLALSPELQRREQLLNTAGWPIVEGAEDDPIGAAQRLKWGNYTNAGRDIRMVVKQPFTLMNQAANWAATGQPVRQKARKIGFVIGSEQTPNPDSRITLTDKRDALGLPIARTDWRISEQDRASQARLANLIQEEFTRLGLPKGYLADWTQGGRYNEAVLVDGCHPTATTRMAADPKAGVVDANCQVHGVDGLFVASSSVFPTAGHANPTLMIVAIAARLADHLKTQFNVSRAGSTIRGAIDLSVPAGVA